MPTIDPEKRKANANRYRIKNRAKINENNRLWYLATKERRLEYDQEYTQAHTEKRLLIRARYRAKKKGWEFSIDESDIIIPDTCPVLGTPLLKPAIRSKDAVYNNDASPSLDRIDNSKGYIKGNVWVISWRANLLKNNATLDELEKLVAVLKEKLKGDP